jgi:hypothetical protein
MRRRHNDPWDQPWVTIAAAVGVIAVIVIAAFFFFGSGSSTGQPAASGSPSATSGSSSSSASVSGTLNPTAIKEQPTMTVPATGVWVKVSYLGSFSGQYGPSDGAMVTAKDSGDKAYEIVNATGTVTASFKKTDTSTKPHDLTVEIWKEGKVLKFNTSSAPKGEASVSYTL